MDPKMTIERLFHKFKLDITHVNNEKYFLPIFFILIFLFSSILDFYTFHFYIFILNIKIYSV